QAMVAEAVPQRGQQGQQGQQGQGGPMPPLVQNGGILNTAPINGRMADEIHLAAQPVDDPRQQMQAGGGGGVAFARDQADFARKEAVANILTVREFAHTLRPNWSEGSRADFAETVYWNAGV